MPTAPDRLTVSIPPDDELDTEVIDELVEKHDLGSRSELVREAVKELAEDK